MKKRSLFFLALFVSSFSAFSQLPNVGHWRAHVNYTNGKSVASGGGKTYMASEMGLFSYDSKETEIERYTKIDGLSDIEFEHLIYNKKTDALLIVYSNSNMDILKDGKIHNMRDIRRSPIVGDKTIYGFTQKEELVFLATGFGVVSVDLKKLEVTGTYQFGPNGQSIKTNRIVVTADSIFAATENGIYEASIKNGNLQDYNFWQKKTDVPDPEIAVKEMVYFNNKLHIIKANSNLTLDTATKNHKDSIFYLEQGMLHYFPRNNDDFVYSLMTDGDLLYLTSIYYAAAYDNTGKRKFYIADYYSNLTPQPRSIAVDEKGYRWIADATQGLVFTQDGVITQVIKAPNGPKSKTAYKLSAAQNEVWIAPGAKNGMSVGMFHFEPISYFKEGSWNAIIPSTEEQGNVLDILTIAVNPFSPNEKTYGASFTDGLAEFQNGTIVKNYKANNSPLEKNTNNWTVVPSAAFDKNNNLWMINQSGKSKIKVLKPDGSWKEITIPGISPTEKFGEIYITSNNHKWITLLQNTQQMRILVYDDNNTLDDVTDDRIKIIGTEAGNGAIPGLSVISMAEDLEGKMWLGTESGVAVIYNPGSIFSNSNFDAQKIKIHHEGNVQILLENEGVTSIAIDGANRKWFGTDGGGVFLMSADGTQQLATFNKANSPLFSDVITSIAITKNGEVFIATEKGILSYRGTATSGGEKHGAVVAFPNPVNSDYEGLVAIKGLVKDADVKITDISGNLVHQSIANGGQAIWNGQDLRGRRVKTGVYLVFSTNSNGTETLATKIMFIN